MTSKEAIREPAEWLAMDKAGWRKREGERWRGKWKVKREHEREEREGQTEEAERQEQWEPETRWVCTPTTTCSCSAPPPPLNPGSTTAQPRLTREEAKETHQECICTQRESQEEMDRRQGEQTAEQEARNTL
jgi:hypothetical protein